MSVVGRSLRIDGWGFEGEAVPVPAAMRRWLEARVGAGTPQGRLETVAAVPPRSLPALPAEASTEARDRLLHARGRSLPDLIWLRSGRPPAVPDAVVRPADSGEVAAVLAACSAAGVRVVPWGGGTSVTGGVNPPAGPVPVVSLDLERLAGLSRFDGLSRLASFGAGTRGPAVEDALAAHGMTLGHFPQSWELSTLGGWIATRSSGQESLGYGRIDDLVAGLACAAPAGRLDLPPQPASAAGPELRRFLLGSEGRFGVITEATMRVVPRPPARAAEAYLLPDWGRALEAARDLVHGGIPLSMLRLSDPPETEVAMAVGLAGHSWGSLARGWLRLRGAGSGSCLLLLAAAGSRAEVEDALADAASRLRRHRAVGLGRGPGRRWLADRFRHPYLRDSLLDLGIATDTLETAAPWAELPRLHAAVEAALPDVPVLCHLSHPYADGASLYFTFFFPCAPEPAATVEAWARLKRAATGALVAAGGTLSHHHGVGSMHGPWYPREVGEAGVRMVAAVARELDPAGILNPHVLLDPVDRLAEGGGEG